MIFALFVPFCGYHIAAVKRVLTIFALVTKNSTGIDANGGVVRIGHSSVMGNNTPCIRHLRSE
jgi:hypothetical protein